MPEGFESVLPRWRVVGHISAGVADELQDWSEAHHEDVDILVKLPVYRFWSARKKGHFYTMSASEKAKLINEYSHTWTCEGIAWYAYE